MRLDFNVLWIDNQPRNIKSTQERLELKAHEEGFRLRVQDALSFEEAQQYLSSSVFQDNIDLVLVDYDLGMGVSKGDAAVREIRNIAQYKDIILYSAIETINLKQAVLNEGIEGIFCAHRDDLTDTMIGVFDTLVKKVLDLDHCRGIVMGVTSDIDQIVSDCLLELVPKLSPQHYQTAMAYSLKKLNERMNRIQGIVKRLEEAQSLVSVLDAHEFFTAENRLGLLKKVLGLHYENTHAGTRKAIGKYANEVPPRRNELGHVRLVAVDGTRSLRGRGAKTISADELKKLRKVLIAYRDDFDILAEIVGLTLSNVSSSEVGSSSTAT